VGRAVTDFPTALDVVGRADMPNLGIGIDSFHALAAKTHLDELEMVLADTILMVQLSDFMVAELPSNEERIATASHLRVFPGEGMHSAGLAELVQRLNVLGYRGDYSFAVFNDDYRQMDPAKVAERARRCAIWLGEEVLQRAPLPWSTRLKRQAAADLKNRLKGSGHVARNRTASGARAGARAPLQRGARSGADAWSRTTPSADRDFVESLARAGGDPGVHQPAAPAIAKISRRPGSRARGAPLPAHAGEPGYVVTHDGQRFSLLLKVASLGQAYLPQRRRRPSRRGTWTPRRAGGQACCSPSSTAWTSCTWPAPSVLVLSPRFHVGGRLPAYCVDRTGAARRAPQRSSRSASTPCFPALHAAHHRVTPAARMPRPGPRERLRDRRPAARGGLSHHRGRGAQSCGESSRAST
jgi:hypothetical protein